MTEISQVPLDFKEAWDFAGLESIKIDLEWVREAGQLYLHDFKKINAPNSYIVQDVFCSAIVLRYGRANDRSRCVKMPGECIEALTREEKADHKCFMNLRDKFYAHSVNNYDSCIPKAWIKNKDSADPQFDKVGVLYQRIVSLGPLEMRKIVSLAEKLLSSLEPKIKEEKDEVTGIAKKIPISELVVKQFSETKQTRKSAGKRRKRKT